MSWFAPLIETHTKLIDAFFPQSSIFEKLFFENSAHQIKRGFSKENSFNIVHIALTRSLVIWMENKIIRTASSCCCLYFNRNVRKKRGETTEQNETVERKYYRSNMKCNSPSLCRCHVVDVKLCCVVCVCARL